MLVKDNLDVAGLPTTAGASRSSTRSPTDDSTVVAQLRAAGAVILGKTNLTEFANFITNSNPSGYSGLGGQVLQPARRRPEPERLVLRLRPRGRRRARGRHDRHRDLGLDRQPVGGAGHRRPAADRRPRQPRTGILPISASQDTAGPMTRTVADAAAELQAIAGADPRDPPGALRRADPAGPAGAARLPRRARRRTRWPASGSASSTTTTRSYQAAVAAVQALGAVTVADPGADRPAPVPQILTYEFKRDLNAYLAHLGPGAPMKSLADIIAFNERAPAGGDQVRPDAC